MMAGTGVSVGGAGMLRTRRRDVSVKPNRKLDRKSSRGMIYENEELRLRTIHINAEVEQGQNDIKKLRRENEQLRREIWSLRDEYDKLEEILKRQKSRGESEEYEDRSEEDDDGLRSDYSCEEEEEPEEENDDSKGTSKDHNKEEQLENVENQKISSEKMTSNSLHRLHVDFDDLSVVDEEEELKKDKERKEASLDDGQQRKEETRNPPAILRPRQLHENIPFYPATYEPSNTFSSSSYYTDCPFEFPSTVDLMVPADATALSASSYSRLHGDPLIPVASLDASCLERVGDQMLPRIHAPPIGWQSNVALSQNQLATYQTAKSVASAAVTQPEMQMFGATDTRVREEPRGDQQRGFASAIGTSYSNYPTLLQRRTGNLEQSSKFFNGNPFVDHQAQHSSDNGTAIVENGWNFGANAVIPMNGANDRKRESGSKGTENRNADGIFTFAESEKPKHFFAPLFSKLKKPAEDGSPTTSHFGTGNSSSSGKTGSTVISKNQFVGQKGSADIYVNGAIPCEDNAETNNDEQRTYLSTDNLLIADDKSIPTNQLVKSLSCQDLTSESQNAAFSEQFKLNHGEGRQQMLTQSDNTLDNIPSDVSSKPYKSHLTVTLKMPRANRVPASPNTPEIPKLPSIDYKIFRNPFLRTFDQNCRNFGDRGSPVTSPLSVQVNDDNLRYRYPTSPDTATLGRGCHPDDKYRTTSHGPSDQNRLLIPTDQLINGKIISSTSKDDIQVTSFERPSPHTLMPPPGTPYDLDAFRRINANPYLQSRNLYQNVPFVPRGPAHLYPQRSAMRMYYENSAVKVPAQTQTSIDGDSHQDDDRAQSQQDEECVSVPNSPCGQRRRRTVKKEKTGTLTKEQKPLSPAAQRRLKKQSSVTSSEAPESPGKLPGKRPRKLSLTTTTTTSEGQEDKNESRSSSSGQDSPRKDQTRRVSLYFNAKKRPSLTSVKTTRSGSLDATKDRYADGVNNSDRERTNSISSRETASAKVRKASTSSGNVPWCACWGNGCI